MMDKKTYIAFDQYQRYQTIFNIIDFFRKNDPKRVFSILEIGSNEHKDLKLFLPTDNITFTDLYLTDAMKQDADFQQADGTNLQYLNDSFDFVIATDVLEHIPEKQRSDFCNELGRVAKLASVICFPYQSTENQDAEERLNAYYKGLYSEDFIWLKEHKECGLPKLEDIDAIYSEMNHSYLRFFHGNLAIWEKMWYCHFNTCGMAASMEYRHMIDHYYNLNIYNTDIAEPCYRAFYVYLKSSVKSLSEYIDNMWKPQNEKSNMLNFLLNTHLHMVEQNEIAHKALNTGSKAATVYWAEEGQVFQESRKYQYLYSSIENDIRMQIQLKDKVYALRFDPIESPCVVEDLHVYSDQGVLQTIPENAVLFHGKYIFLNCDPKFEIVIDGKQIANLDIRAHVTPLFYPEQEELLSMVFHEKDKMEEQQKQLLEQMQNEKERYEDMLLQNKAFYEEEIAQIQQAHEKIISETKKNYQNTLDEYMISHKQEIEKSKKEYEEVVAKRAELQSSLDHYILHYNAAISQREELKKQLSEIRFAYDTISNAFFWKITSPARHLTDGIKRILHHFRFTSLICKGLRCLHQNGFRYTWKKTRNKWQNRKEAKKGLQMQVLSEAELQRQRETEFQNKIKFSILTPLYNTPEKFLKEMIESVQAQTYFDWELCLADGSDSKHSEVGKIVSSYAKHDKRIKYKKLEQNKGISENTNACIDLATGDYIVLLDHDDLLSPNALYEVMCEIQKSGADFIYSDEATFSETVSNIITPHYKPGYSPDTLRVVNYICHITVVSRELLNRTGKFNSKYDGSQDHDFVIRATDNAKLVKRIPKFLYFWRYHTGSTSADISTKSYAIEAAFNLLKEDAQRRGMTAKVESLPICPTMYRIRYEIMSEPKVSILIPTKDAFEYISTCINSILENTTYRNYEIIIIDTGTSTEEVFSYYKALSNYSNIKVLYYDKPFNYSDVNNFGANYATGEQIVLLNNDTKIITPDWIQEMLMYAQREDVGAVGAKLYYEDNTIQHAGVGIGIFGLAGHFFNGCARNDVGYMGRLYWVQNLSAVTGACVMIPKKVWDEVHGLDNWFDIAFSDIDLCMRIRRAGYLVVWTPFAELYHFESKTLGYMTTPEKQERFQADMGRFKERFAKELSDGDPYYNPNLTLERTDYTLK